MCGALQAPRNGEHTQMAGDEDGSNDGDVEGAQIKDGVGDVGTRRRGAELLEEEREDDCVDARSDHVRDASWLTWWSQCEREFRWFFTYVGVG